MDSGGNLYIADSNSPRIRKLTAPKRMTTVEPGGEGLFRGGAARTDRVSPAAVPDVTCIANAAAPPTVPSEGLTVISGDIVVNCSGGTPMAAGVLVPTMNLTVFYNTQVTGRLLNGGGEPSWR